MPEPLSDSQLEGLRRKVEFATTHGPDLQTRTGGVNIYAEARSALFWELPALFATIDELTRQRDEAYAHDESGAGVTYAALSIAIDKLRVAEDALRWLANCRDGLPPQYRDFLAPWVTLQRATPEDPERCAAGGHQLDYVAAYGTRICRCGQRVEYGPDQGEGR